MCHFQEIEHNPDVEKEFFFMSSGIVSVVFLPLSKPMAKRSSRVCRKMQHPHAAPDANNTHPFPSVTVHDAKWRMDEFAQEVLSEFRHHPAHVGMVDRGLNAMEDFLHILPDFRYTLALRTSLVG